MPVPPDLLPSRADVDAAKRYCSEQRRQLGLDPDPDAPPIQVFPATGLALLLSMKPEAN